MIQRQFLGIFNGEFLARRIVVGLRIQLGNLFFR